MRKIFTKIFFFSLLLVNSFANDCCCESEEEERTIVEMYNAPYKLKCNWNAFITASFIYWQAIEDGLNLAFFKDGSYNKAIKTDFDFKPGFKIGLGVNTHYDNWLLYSEYTRLSSHGHSCKNAQGAEELFPLWVASTIDNSAVIASSARGNWELKLNFLDLDLGRPYYVGSKMALNTFIGLRAVWIDQEFTALYNLTSPISGFAKRNVDSDSWGIGARLGIDASYFAYKELRILGSAAGSLFFQHYDLSTKCILRNSLITNEKASEKTSNLTPNLEAKLGLGWGKIFYRNKVHIDFNALYEFQIFWNQNMLRSFKDLMTNSVNGASGDLMFQGLTLTARLDF